MNAKELHAEARGIIEEVEKEMEGKGEPDTWDEYIAMCQLLQSQMSKMISIAQRAQAAGVSVHEMKEVML